MAQENFNVSEPNDGLGDKLRAAFIKVQSNFTDLFTDKVDKEAGKGLSTNDYTTTERIRLANIEDFAEVNVQSDFLQNDDTQDDFIKNKPTIPVLDDYLLNGGYIGTAQDIVDNTTLQSVTDNGNETTRAMIVRALELPDIFAFIFSQGFVTQNIQTGQSTRVEFDRIQTKNKNGEFENTVVTKNQVPTVSAIYEQLRPNKSGTFAMLSDLPIKSVLANVTLTPANWTLVAGNRQATITDVLILAGSTPIVTPTIATANIADLAEIFEDITVSNGSFILTARYLPTANIVIKTTIL